MINRYWRIWAAALLVALMAIVFPPRRDTEQGRDRASIPSRRFLWSADLYQGSLAGTNIYLVARIDVERLATELLALATMASFITLMLRAPQSRVCSQPEVAH
jgi:hypothetical protein